MHFYFLAYLALSLISIACAIPPPSMPNPAPPSKFIFKWDERLGEPWVRGDHHKDWDPTPLALLLMRWVVNQEEIWSKLGFKNRPRDSTLYQVKDNKPFPYVQVLPNQQFRFFFHGGGGSSRCRNKWCEGSVGIEFPKDYSATSPAFYVAEVVHLGVSLRVPIPFDAEGEKQLEWQRLHEQIAYQHELYNRLVAIDLGREPPKVNPNILH
ncbi:hypothetical protein BT96DRAFT_1020359 [Gymnopus androsaceus JB14]|uniref:Uncharacterized protein n=1 Tax=Gymnopus androsaceus JB14 TaxID=1447944 RepID=A0A6A4HMW1_9AGAR|nr:hypothetical protein BT96DRAFT_1020359 [Gymnopus androsaceus JB14]